MIAHPTLLRRFVVRNPVASSTNVLARRAGIRVLIEESIVDAWCRDPASVARMPNNQGDSGVESQKKGPGWFEDAALVVHRPLVLDAELVAQAIKDAQRVLESARGLGNQDSGAAVSTG